MSTTYRDRIYEKYASQFKGGAGRFDEAAAQRAIRPYAHYLRGWLPAGRDTAIVDVGCGAGQLLYFFRQQGYANVHGVDISGEQVAMARQVVPDVEQGDVLAYLRSHPGQFELISAVDLIEHLTKAEILDFLDACHGALRPGGRLIVQTPNGFSPWCTAIRFGDFTHEFCFTPQLLGQMLGLCGFVQYEAREQGPVPYGAASAARWALWQVIKMQLVVWNLAETGSQGPGIYTRVFVGSAVKPDASVRSGASEPTS